MTEHWPTGFRETTQLIQIREHLKAMLRLDGFKWSDQKAQSEATGLTPQRIRTNRKMYEVLGLLYKDSENKIRLSNLGYAIKNLDQSISQMLSGLQEKVVKTLARYQLNNPVDRDKDMTRDHDVQPFLCMWKIMSQLENKLHNEEFNRVLFRIMKMSDIDAAIEKITKARLDLQSYQNVTEDQLVSALGRQVFSDQPPARISAWCSLAGWGGLVLTDSDSSGFRYLKTEALPAVLEAISNPPKFFFTDNEQEWYSYYLQDLNEVSPEDRSLSDVDMEEEKSRAFLIQLKEMIVSGEFTIGVLDGDYNAFKIGDEIWVINEKTEISHVLEVKETFANERKLVVDLLSEILPPLTKEDLLSIELFNSDDVKAAFDRIATNTAVTDQSSEHNEEERADDQTDTSTTKETVGASNETT